MMAIEEGVHDNLICPPAQEDLAVVYKRDRRRYDRIIARALDPYQVDEDGYSSISELLEQSQALDPTRPKNPRLTNNALARIALDVASGRPPNESWVGNRTKGPYKKLLTDRSLRVTQIEVAKQLTAGKSVATFSDRPLKASDKRGDDSDIEEDGVYTVRPPS
ncbi:hypothetical protein PC116_g15125 [Phytophthora cactorum]|uniref:Uncharacterized protein n=2 Tax=Phytophthora cactorum TaxID=29920 RepID=A0A8T0Z205_9STRA|nr:hypothetical protein Pcac1_g7491 [Phytophthora cactorum]KAG2798572.1 hypothetical protein PC111_g20799 [Phytophthora cactorum]KAG2820990.1 hypothetical protein PC112_g11548 [Phytophthora cactorum]KAG2856113.1 hypothetical protein PC113_g11873 [Phytophthora cactorum]KAG2902446.1 hypothetical protein PC114_g12733 [Phytophthora cactorum]